MLDKVLSKKVIVNLFLETGRRNIEYFIYMDYYFFFRKGIVNFVFLG